MTREKSIESYKLYIKKKLETGELDLKELKGKVLGCWCSPLPCHGDTLIELLKSNEEEEK
jgi:hypothetical protein